MSGEHETYYTSKAFLWLRQQLVKFLGIAVPLASGNDIYTVFANVVKRNVLQVLHGWFPYSLSKYLW